MECPHILTECKINRELIKTTRKCQLIDTSNCNSIRDQTETAPPPSSRDSNASASTITTTTVEEHEQKSSSSSSHQLLKWKCSGERSQLFFLLLVFFRLCDLARASYISFLFFD